jgi:Replication-relaxation
MNEAQDSRARPTRVTKALLVELASRLTERDRQIALDCYEQYVLTTTQLQRLHFSGVRVARARLDKLYTLRVLDHFRPPWRRGEGSTPWHWILDEAGTHIVAEHAGIKRNELKWHQGTALALADSPKLRHRIEINEFFAHLAEEIAAAGGFLTEWYGERTTQHLFNGKVIPDGYGVLNLPDRLPVHILLELDRATEPVGQLREKAKRYATEVPRSAVSDVAPLVIIVTSTPARAQAISKATSDSGARIAVAVWGPSSSALTIVRDAADALTM